MVTALEAKHANRSIIYRYHTWSKTCQSISHISSPHVKQNLPINHSYIINALEAKKPENQLSHIVTTRETKPVNHSDIYHYGT
jgi:hypothetical protein